MKKTIYLLTITIITVICIIVGSLYHIGNVFPFKIFDGKIYLTKEEDDDINLLSEENSSNEFASIDATFEIANITIQTGEEYRISFDGNSKLKPNIDITDNVLTLTQNKIKNNFNLLRPSKYKCNLTITIPKDKTLDDVNLNTNIGDINILDVCASNVTIKADIGDLDIENAQTGDTTIEANIGDIKLTDSQFENLDITADIGDIKVYGVKDLEPYDFDLENDLGDIKINETKYSRTYATSNNKDFLIKVHNDTGDIKIQE